MSVAISLALRRRRRRLGVAQAIEPGERAVAVALAQSDSHVADVAHRRRRARLHRRRLGRRRAIVLVRAVVVLGRRVVVLAVVVLRRGRAAGVGVRAIDRRASSPCRRAPWPRASSMSATAALASCQRLLLVLGLGATARTASRAAGARSRRAANRPPPPPPPTDPTSDADERPDRRRALRACACVPRLFGPSARVASAARRRRRRQALLRRRRLGELVLAAAQPLVLRRLRQRRRDVARVLIALARIALHRAIERVLELLGDARARPHLRAATPASPRGGGAGPSARRRPRTPWTR